ncbi:MAG: hypothetical protein OSA44_07950 [Nitrospinaceae bacterium]|nr:hypothetical protein [Nitrospinaceae bacterium]
MKFLQISTLWLALFLLVGAGCGEQKQKSKERGQAIVDTVKDAEKNINDAVLKMQEKVNQLEETDN